MGDPLRIRAEASQPIFSRSREQVKGQGAAQASRRGTGPRGRKKTGRGRDEAAEATARPQEYVDHTKAALSGWRTKGAQTKGDPPPSLETTVLRTVSKANSLEGCGFLIYFWRGHLKLAI